MIMVQSRVLASGHINGSDMISVELIEPVDTPSVVMIKWPHQPSVADPRRFPTIAATVARLMATASTTLAQIRARRA
jgi:hypothetical protein